VSLHPCLQCEVIAAKVLLDKWSNHGLDPAVLAKIHTEVRDAVAPAP